MQEESRRLQLQSQMLQQRALEMSMRMSSSGGGNRPPQDAVNSSSDRAQPTAAAVVQLSQVSDLSAVMAAQGDHGGPMQYTQHDYPEEPASQANSVLDAEAYMQADDSLVPPDGMMPRHPPGDVRPSSVTSSRAGLHWNIPSRGSIPASPGNPGSRGDPRYARQITESGYHRERAVEQRCQVLGFAD